MSGDLHGAAVARALRTADPGLRLIGLGGAEMEQAGVERMAGLDDLAVMGFAEVARRLPFFLELERRIVRLLESGEVDLFLPIDYPGLNLRLAGRARAAGVPVLYYIAPQVWAWKEHRARALARDARKVAVILPFEEDFLRDRGVDAEYVGHPLLDEEAGVGSPSGTSAPDPEPSFPLPGLPGDPEPPLLALLPGSRRQELERHLPLFLETARQLQALRPGLQPVLAAAPGVSPDWFDGVGFPVVRDARALLRRSRVALVKSGTSTLEAALAGVPFAVTYRTSALTFAIARRFVRVDQIALANLVAGSRVVPEFIQSEASPDRLVASLLSLLDDGADRDRMLGALQGIRARLGRGGAASRVAQLALELLPPGVDAGSAAGIRPDGSGPRGAL